MLSVRVGIKMINATNSTCNTFSTWRMYVNVFAPNGLSFNSFSPTPNLFTKCYAVFPSILALYIYLTVHTYRECANLASYIHIVGVLFNLSFLWCAWLNVFWVASKHCVCRISRRLTAKLAYMCTYSWHSIQYNKTQAATPITTY